MELNLLKATQMLERTMPILNRRILIYAAITMGLLLSIPIGAGSFFGLASFSDNPGFWGQIGAIFGLAAAIYGLRMARPALFFHLDLVQMSAIVKRLQGENLPSGKELNDSVKRQVSTLFQDPGSAWSYRLKLHQLIHLCASRFPVNRAVPSPLKKWLLAGFVPDALFAPAIKENDFSALRKSAIAFCRKYQDFSRISLILNAFLFGMSFIAFWLLLTPVGWVDEALPISLGVWKYVFAAILTFWIKVVFLDPIAATAMIMNLLETYEATDTKDIDEWPEILSVLEPLAEAGNQTGQ